MPCLIFTGEVTKPAQIQTPQTPRHRDALSKKIPVTPQHRVTVLGKPLTPRTPRTPFTPCSVPTIYSSARQLFVRSANPGRLVGREEERNELKKFIHTGIESMSGRCMYVSGPPGTGKSALVGEVCGELQGIKDVRTAYINCMSIKNSKDIYSKLLEDLLDTDAEMDGEEATMLKAMFLPQKDESSKIYVVSLDEIDHLLSLDLDILYTLFEWSLARSSRLILVGIANALDLTDRFLPRLKARNLKPQLLPFLPYTVSQIISVITTKLRSSLSVGDTTTTADYIPFLHPAAIQLCAKKVASQTGDLRKAFDIVRRTIDLIETETKQKHQNMFNAEALQFSPCKTPLVDNINLSSSSPSEPFRTRKPQATKSLASSLATLTSETAPRATIAHVARVTAQAFGNGTKERLAGLNLQQKAALCALLAYENKARAKTALRKPNSDGDVFAAAATITTPSRSTAPAAAAATGSTSPTVRQLYEMYCGLCKREGALHALTGTEFADVVSSLEGCGLVGLDGVGWVKGKMKGGGREERRVGSCVAEREVEGVLEGVGGGILRGLLRGE